MKNKAVFKWNGGNPVILCSKCSVIIKYWNDFTEDEKLSAQGKKYLPKQYCNKCKDEYN